jgi:N-acyl-D-amino-acid deacylase
MRYGGNMRFYKNILIIFALILLFTSLSSSPSNQVYDLVIKNGTVIDGSGNPWYKADIGIKDKHIVKIGKLDKTKALRTIDAHNLIVAPGFVDVHTHTDRGILRVPTVDNYIHQGVTSVIGGNCGGHPFPLQDLFDKIKENGVSPNFGCLIGHNTIRREVMELKMELPSPQELEQMKVLIEQEMRAGGLGFSTGLSYLPGIYSKTDEIVALASVVAKYGGIYASHIRDQGLKITEAIQEAIEIGEKNNIPVLISHIKLAEDAVWNELERIVKPVEDARKRGVEVTIDQYPYTATSSGFTSSFPSWVFEGGRDKFLERMKDKATYEKVKTYVIKRRLTSTRGIDKPGTIYIGRSRQFSEYEGKNLKEILISQGKKPTVENTADLIIEIEKNGGASGVFFQMDEQDVEELMKLPYLMHGSDGGVQAKGRGVPHPRNYGTFPRVIGNYVREEQVLSLENAIKKMTSFPAQTMRLGKRGLLREGLYADITIFDYATFGDMATFSDPHQFSKGLVFVIVNGEIVVEKGKHTGKLPGMILYGRGKSRNDH